MKHKKQLAVLVILLLILGAVWFFYFDHDRPVVTADASSVVQNYKPLGVDNPPNTPLILALVNTDSFSRSFSAK